MEVHPTGDKNCKAQSVCDFDMELQHFCNTISAPSLHKSVKTNHCDLYEEMYCVTSFLCL